MFRLPPGNVPLPKLLLLNMAACGGELGFSSVTTIAPPLLRRHNFSETTMSIAMGIGPFLALLAMPSLGRWTDRCTSRMGRRKPFLLVCSMLLLFGIMCISNVDQLSAACDGVVPAGLILVVSVVVCTFAAQVFYTPYQALISDLCRTEVDARRGFSVFVLMTSVGSVGSNLLFSWDWFPGSVESSQRASFSLIAALIAVQTAITLLTVQEPAACAPGGSSSAGSSSSSLLEDVGYASDLSELGSPLRSHAEKTLMTGTFTFLAICGQLTSRLLAVPLVLCTLAARVVVWPCWMVRQVVVWPYWMVRRIQSCPMVLRRLFVVDLMSWMALISFYMFITDYLGQAFGGRVEEPEGTEARAKFDAGVRMGAKCLLVDAVSASLFSLLCMSPLTRRLGTRGAYVLCLAGFSVGLVAISLTSSVSLIYLLCALMGCGYSAIGTIPNTLLTLYHYQPEVFFADRPSSEATGLGENFAILDMSYCMSSIVPSLTLGYVVDVFHMPHLYVLVGGLLGLMSAAAATTLVYKAEDMPPRTKPFAPGV